MDAHPSLRSNRKRQMMDKPAESHPVLYPSGFHSPCSGGFTRWPSLLLLLAVFSVVFYVFRYAFIRPPAPTPNGFGTVRWGMTEGEVRNVAPNPPVQASATVLAYDTTVLGRPCRVFYAFHKERLAAARLQFSAPGVATLPGLSQQQAAQTYKWLKGELATRYDVISTYGYPRETKNSHARPEVAEYEARLAEVRQRILKRTTQLRSKYTKQHRRDVEALIERELASEYRLARDLEQWLNDTRATDRQHPMMNRLETVWELATWDARAMLLDLFVDFATVPPTLEIRYRVLSNRRPATVSDEI